MNYDQRRMKFPISSEDEALMEALNKELYSLLRRPQWDKFQWIGSGFQVKFGETVIARQDNTRSITEPQSQRLKQAVQEQMRAVDPTGKRLSMHDTGLDLEIFPTRKGGQPSFTKGDGVAHLDKALDLGISEGPNLVCGDTVSDLPMVERTVRECPNGTVCIFVTKDQVLAAKVRSTCPKALIVESPDILVAILNKVATTCGAQEGAKLKRNARL